MLRAKGIYTASIRPEVLEWAENGVSDEIILEAVDIAKLNKPDERVSSAYLAPIVKQLLNPKPKKTQTLPWWTSEELTEKKAREVGCWPARAGENWNQYRQRIKEKIEGNK